MVTVHKPVLVSNVGARHGEGPLWHAADRRLDWTDLAAGRLHRFDPLTERDEVLDVGSPLGAFAARTRGGYVLAVESGFALLDSTSGQVDLVAEVGVGAEPRVRMNDGKVDPQGRFWAGTMAYDVTRGAAALYRLDRDLSVTEILSAVTVSNGLDWTADGETLYYIDSPRGGPEPKSGLVGVDAFDFDAATGSISNRRRVINMHNVKSGPTGETVPDGMTLDVQGFVWVAVAGGGEVRRYSPKGTLDTVIEMPVASPTSVTFGGADLGDLYITTMTLEAAVPPDHRTHPAFAAPRPDEGGLFRCRPGVPGRPPRMFAG